VLFTKLEYLILNHDRPKHCVSWQRLIGRYGLPVFATGTVLSAMGEVIVETRSEAFSHEVALGAAIVAGGILMHYLVARGLAAWRDKSRARQSMMNRAHTLRMASPLSLRKSAIVLWSGTSRPVSHICPSRKSYPRVAVMESGQDWCDDDRHRSLDVSS
jgi:OpgC protein